MSRKMKDSGVKWIGDIPEEWEVIKTKNIYSSNKLIVGDKASNYERLALTLNGVIKRSKEDSNGLQPEKFEGYQILKKNQLVFKLIDLENVSTSRVGISPYTGLVSPAYIILDNEKQSRFGYYYFISMYYQQIFNKLGGDGVRSNLNSKDLLAIPYLNIEEEEYIRICNYLDKKVSQIDTIISKQKTLIEKYKAYKQSLITETVTKGLNKDVPMKDSGIEWIGEIPSHWKVTKIKNIANVGSGGTPLRNNKEFWNGNINWMSSGEINMQYVYETKEKITEKGLNSISSPLLPVDTVMLGLIGQGKTKGKTAILCVESACNQNLAYCICKKDIYNYKYLFYSFQAMYKFLRGVIGESQAGIYLGFLKECNVTILSIEEQQQIVDFLDKKCNAIDSIISKKEQLIEKLESYKKSLIYECVTGKREVN